MAGLHEIDTSVLRRVIDLLPDEFNTTDASDHPAMLEAHQHLGGDYRQRVGSVLGRLPNEVNDEPLLEKISGKRPNARWRKRPLPPEDE